MLAHLSANPVRYLIRIYSMTQLVIFVNRSHNEVIYLSVTFFRNDTISRTVSFDTAPRAKRATA